MGMLLDTVFLSWEGEIGHVVLPGAAFLPSGNGFLGRRPLSGTMRGMMLVVTIEDLLVVGNE